MFRKIFVVILFLSFCKSESLISVEIVSSKDQFSNEYIARTKKKINSERESYDENTKTRALEYVKYLQSNQSKTSYKNWNNFIELITSYLIYIKNFFN